MRRFDEADWHRRRDAHRARVEPWVRPRLERRAAGAKHPVDDFLFEYYSYRVGHLSFWHPGIGVSLTGPSAQAYLDHRGYRLVGDGVSIDPAQFVRRIELAHRIHDLLEQTASRPARFGCYGLHEWAMVYHLDQESVRHSSWVLRLSPEEIAAVVDEQGLRCSHHDAVRFFTPAARRLNLIDVTRASQADDEQPGCLHANMDLYKWAYKLSPMTSSDLVADAFELAREIRTVDMRASPYDLRDLGLEPIAVETPKGRLEYAAAQESFSQRAQVIRTTLLVAVSRIVEPLTTASAATGTPQSALSGDQHRTTPHVPRGRHSPQARQVDASR